jgi:hypothetical protein
MVRGNGRPLGRLRASGREAEAAPNSLTGSGQAPSDAPAVTDRAATPPLRADNPVTQNNGLGPATPRSACEKRETV